MSNKKRPANRPTPRGAATARARSGGSNRTTWFIVVAVVVVVGVALLVAVLAGGGSKNQTATTASGSVVSKVQGVPEATLSEVGTGTTRVLPTPINAPALNKDGKPLILFVGAEYCPYCATERWPIAIALSRFGSFTGLKVTHSSADDVYPNTQTLSFHGVAYTSTHVSLEAKEIQGNTLVNGKYETLDTLTAEQQKLFATYNAPPYTQSSGSIPFLLIGGKYVMSGAAYDPQVLQGMTADQIATALRDPSSDIAKGALGTANGITAAICDVTGNQPAAVCSSKTITDLQAKIKAGTTPS